MSALTTIAKREFRSYFDSPIAYVVICLSFLGLGIMFFMGRNAFFEIERATIESLYAYAAPGISILVSVVTMGAIAEERRSGTWEMLLTLPVKDSDVMLGKYFGALSLVLTVITALLIYPFAMFIFPWHLGALDWGPVLSGYFGLVLYAAAAVALGLFISAMTNSQAISFFISFFTLTVFWFLGSLAERLGGITGDILHYISFQTRLSSFLKGLVEARDVFFLASVIFLALVFAFRKLEGRKWA